MVSTNYPITPLNLGQYLKKLSSLLSLPQRVKTPTLLQMEAVECGAAALGIVMYYFGLVRPLPELRRECGVSRDGSKASNMLKAARRYGLEAKGFKKELKQLPELPLPYIVFWNFNHFLVVEGWGKDRVYLNDPATGPCTVSLQEFDKAYTGVVLLIRPGTKFQKGGQQQNLRPALWSRLRGTTGALIYCLLSGLFLTLISLVIPVFTQIFVDEILIQGRQFWLRPLLFAMAIAVVLQGALTLLQLRYLRRLKIKLAVGMSSRFLWHILRLPVSFYAQRFAGEISSRTRLNDQVADILSGQLATTAINFVMLGFYIIVMSQYDWLLTVMIVSFAFINVLTLQWISRQRKDANQRLIQDYGKAAGVSIAALQSIETLKASGLESDVFARWSGYYTKAINSQQELGVANHAISVLPVLLSALSSAFFLVLGGLRVMDGYLSIGMLVAFQGMMQNFQQPVNNLVNFGSTLQELEGNLIRLDDVLSNPIDQSVALEGRRIQESKGVEKEESRGDCSLALGEERTKVTIPKLEGYLELRNLTDVIHSMPGGYNAQLAEGGANLSGGQRQRLEIARALVNNPSILIMDEATSALDGETEKIIDLNLRRRGCTCLIIAHRLSTIRDCDEIIVLDRGKIVQRGTHETLWQEEGMYAQLIKSSA